MPNPVATTVKFNGEACTMSLGRFTIPNVKNVDINVVSIIFRTEDGKDLGYVQLTEEGFATTVAQLFNDDNRIIVNNKGGQVQ